MQEQTFRKSLPAYLWPVLWLFVKIALAWYVWTKFAFMKSWLMSWSDVPTNYAHWIAVAVVAFLIWRVVRGIGHIVWLTTYRVTVSEAGVTVKYGVMPWNAYERHWEPNQIFNCLYQSSGFFNWAVRQGNLVLQGAEGATHQFIFYKLGRVRTACEMVNQIRARNAPTVQSGSM